MREYGHDQNQPKVSNYSAVLNSLFFFLFFLMLVEATNGLKIDLQGHAELWEICF